MYTDAMQILRQRTSRTVRPGELNLRSPELDFEGYWLFALFSGPGPFRGVKMGFSVGRYEGTDLGVDAPGDPGNVLCVVDLITESRALSFSTNRLHRSQITSSPEGVDILFGPYGRFRGAWPALDFQIRIPEARIDIDLRLSGHHAHWWPDLVLPGTFYRQYVCPDMEIRGSITAEGVRQEVIGMGALDRPFGRLVKSPSSPGVGYWHYDVISWNDQFTSVGWHISDAHGHPFLHYGMANPSRDELTLFHDFRIEYLQMEQRGGASLPRRWRAVLNSPEANLTYEVDAIGQEWDPDQPDATFLLPNLLMRCRGRFKDRSREISLSGYGLPEYHVAHRGPHFEIGNAGLIE